MADWNVGKICPHLGSTQDRDLCWAFPHTRQSCWSPGVPKEPRSACAPLNLDLQKHWCLGERHLECPYFVPPEKRAPIQPRNNFMGVTGRCPLLGVPEEPTVYHAYPSGQNVCHSRQARSRRGWQQKYAQASRETQMSYCLTSNYPQCPHFEEVPAPTGRDRRQPLPSQDFLRMEGRCPCLGTKHAREIYRIYPSRENICYSPGSPPRLPWQKPNTVPADIQGAYCLTRRYTECEYFAEDSPGPPRRRRTNGQGSERVRVGSGASRLALFTHLLWAWFGGLLAFLRADRIS